MKTKAKHRVLSVLMAAFMLVLGVVPAQAAHDPFSPFDPDTMQGWGDNQSSDYNPADFEIGGSESTPPQEEAEDPTEPEDPAEPEDADTQGPQAVAAVQPFEETGTITLDIPMYRNGRAMAARSGQVSQLTVQWVEGYNYDFSISPGFPIYGKWCVYWVNGKVAYCLEPKKLVSTDGKYYTSNSTWAGLNTAQQTVISQIMYYGASSASNIPEHIATQALIWEICMGYRSTDNLAQTDNTIFNGLVNGNSSIANAYGSIEDKVRTHLTIASFMAMSPATATTHKLTESGGSQFTITIPDDNNTLSDMTLVSHRNPVWQDHQERHGPQRIAGRL